MTPKPILTWIQSRKKTDNQALTTPPEEPLKQLQTPKPALDQGILNTEVESKEKIDVEMHLIGTVKDQSDRAEETGHK